MASSISQVRFASRNPLINRARHFLANLLSCAKPIWSEFRRLLPWFKLGTEDIFGACCPDVDRAWIYLQERRRSVFLMDVHHHRIVRCAQCRGDFCERGSSTKATQPAIGRNV